MSSIILASAYAATLAAPAPAGQHHHDLYAAPVSPDQLGGSFEFLDVSQRPVSAAAFQGHWSLLFFGYARCRASCPVATPKIVKAAHLLSARGIETRAVFIDIEPPPLGVVRGASRATAAHGGHGHSSMNHVAAMRALQAVWAGKLTVLTGTRLQLTNAARAFMVKREHRPPRESEKGHSINHSSRIYMIAPDTKVAGYGFHDADPAELVKTVVGLSTARPAAPGDKVTAR